MRVLLLLAGVALVWLQAEASLCPPAPRKSLTGHVRTPHEMICEPCEQLFDPDSDFMNKCGQFLTDFIINKLNTICPNLDVDQIPDFIKNLQALCEFRGYPAFEEPSEDDCACDVCELLFDPNSDFMTKCAFDYPANILTALRYKCDLADCGSYGMIYFRNFLLHHCQSNGRKFRFPTCECDECMIFFDPESPFMEACGAALDADTLDHLYETCSLCMDDVDALFTFFMTVRTLCTGRGFETFRLPFCDCSDFCWHLFDPDRRFYDDCFSQLPFSRRLELFKECREIHQDAALTEEFIEDLEEECLAETGVDSVVPTDCITCPEVDLVLVVDNSGSIFGFEDARDDFLKEIIDTVAKDGTRFGVISFNTGTGTPVHNDLGSDNEKDDAIGAVNAITPVTGRTNTGDAIEEMSQMFLANPDIGNRRIGIVVTDGKSNDGVLDVDEAMGNVPLDVTMIAIGATNSVDLNELLLIAQNDVDRRIVAPTIPLLAGKIDELRTELCD